MGKIDWYKNSFSGFALTCDYLWYYLNNIFVFRVFFQKNETKVALFFWSKPSRNQLTYFLQSLQVSDKPQDDDGASPLSIWRGSNHVTFDFLSWDNL